MDDLLSKINGLLNEAEPNVALSVKKHLVAQFHNEFKKDAGKCNILAKIDELVKYQPDYLDVKKDEVLLASLEIELDSIKNDGTTMVSTNNSKTSSIWIGNVPYNYTGSSHPVLEVSKTPAVSETINQLNKDKRFGGFNSCLAIWYPDNEAALSLHADDEHDQLDLNHPIAIVHIGGPRDLEFYPNAKVLYQIT